MQGSHNNVEQLAVKMIDKAETGRGELSRMAVSRPLCRARPLCHRQGKAPGSHRLPLPRGGDAHGGHQEGGRAASHLPLHVQPPLLPPSPSSDASRPLPLPLPPLSPILSDAVPLPVRGASRLARARLAKLDSVRQRRYLKWPAVVSNHKP